MATILYRKLDANYDPLWGNGQTNFLADLQAVAQAILTRLNIFQGEWWEAQSIGTPMFQSILGSNNGKMPLVISSIIQKRILGTPYVQAISNVQTSFDPSNRTFTYYCTVQTQFGFIAITNSPGSSATIQAS